jgi:hypothetical protein
MFYAEKLLSVIDSNDGKRCFNRIITTFDPNKNRNQKTKVLDLSNLNFWTEDDYRLFYIQKTKNVNGTVKDETFDIIIYEPPKNKSFISTTVNYSKIFKTLLNKNGVVVVKVSDFRQNEYLKGTFDIWDIFDKCNFYLHDNIIIKNKYDNYFDEDVIGSCKIVHFNYMVFKYKPS